MSQDRFEELLSLLLDDDITAEQMDELSNVVAADARLLDRVREHLLMSDRLSQYEDELRSHELFVDALAVRVAADGDTSHFVDRVVASTREQSSSAATATFSRTEKSGWQVALGFAGWITAAVALIMLAGVLLVDNDAIVPGTAEVDETSEEVNDQGVAVLTRVSGLRGDPAVDWTAGETIPPGMLQWDAGLLQLEFYCGATVVAEGPACLEILDDSRVVCHSGRIRAHVLEPARGFAVLAPTVELVDLGTEFGMNVAADGTTEVHVFDGKVELYDAKSNRNVSTRRELNAGDAVTLDHNGESEKIDTRDIDFVTPNRLSRMTSARRQEQLRDWTEFRDSLQTDARVIAYFPFDRNDSEDRILIGYGANGHVIEGAIVGCEWSEGRWPQKTSLQFKRPGDRVRISVPGEFESLTYSTWLRVDGLDRRYNSLLMADEFDTNGPHWQIRRDGHLILGVRHSETEAHDYQTESIFNLHSLGQWVHLATVYDSRNSQVKHYVNGEQATLEPLREAAAGLLKIGDATIGNWSVRTNRRRGSHVRNFNGCMDELIVFGQSLDDLEIRRIYEIGRP